MVPTYGGVVEHGHSVIALRDDHRIEDVQDSLADGEIGHAMVVGILVG